MLRRILMLSLLLPISVPTYTGSIFSKLKGESSSSSSSSASEESSSSSSSSSDQLLNETFVLHIGQDKFSVRIPTAGKEGLVVSLSKGHLTEKVFCPVLCKISNDLKLGKKQPSRFFKIGPNQQVTSLKQSDTLDGVPIWRVYEENKISFGAEWVENQGDHQGPQDKIKLLPGFSLTAYWSAEPEENEE